MAECNPGYEEAVGESGRDGITRVGDLSYDHLRKGAIFRGNIAADFGLSDLDLEDEEEIIADYDPAWAETGPMDNGESAVPALDHLRQRPLPLLMLLPEMEDCHKDGGVKKLILAKGIGKRPPVGSKIWYHYVAYLDEGMEPYDQSLGRNAESFILGGTPEIIPGLLIGLETMELKEISQFVVSPEYAYGKLGCPPRIPKEATIIFTVKTVHFITAEQQTNVLYMSAEERNRLKFKPILVAANDVRGTGNFLYRAGSFGKAIREYRRATDLMEGYWGIHKKADEEIRIEFLCGVSCNMAQAYLKLEKGPQACNACKHAMRYEVERYSGRISLLYGRAKGMLHEYKEALGLIDRALRHGAHKKECEEYRAEFQEALERSEASYAQMCKLMFTSNSDSKKTSPPAN